MQGGAPFGASAPALPCGALPGPRQQLLSAEAIAMHQQMAENFQIGGFSAPEQGSLAAGGSQWNGVAQPIPYQQQYGQQPVPSTAAGFVGLTSPAPFTSPAPYTQPPVLSQGPFTFHAAGPSRPAQTQVSTLSSAAGSSASLDVSSGLLPHMPSTMTFTSTAPAAERSSRRSTLCKQAFDFVDALRTGHLDCSQNKTGLMMVFQQLGDLPMPKDEWYTRVFRNFAGNDKDLIDYRCFKEIVKQWDEHHQKKREKHHQQKEQQHQQTPQQQQQQLQQQQQQQLQQQIQQQQLQQLQLQQQQQQQQQLQQQQHLQQQLQQQQQLPPPSPEQKQEILPNSGRDSQKSAEGTPKLVATVDSAQRAVSASSDQGTASLDQAETGDQEADAGGGRSRPSSDQVAAQIRELPPAASPSRPSQAPSQDESEAPESLLRNQSGLSRATAANIASEVMFPTHVGRLAIFDDYLFCGDVGSGSFGKVMLVRHKSTKQLRACKVVAVQTALQRELMDNEIRLLKSLNHPHIMKMHEVYFEQASESGQVASGNIYLVTELCEGGDLFSRILHHYERTARGHDLLQHMSMTLVNQVQYSEVVEPAWWPMHEEWWPHGTGTNVSLQRNPPVRTLLVARHFWMGPM
eukprot:s1810_g7.t1